MRTNRTVITSKRRAGTNDVEVRAFNGDSDFAPNIVGTLPVDKLLTPEVGESKSDKPLLVKVIHQGGCAEVQWATDDKGAKTETYLDGFVQITPEGKLVVRWYDDDGNPYVFVLDGNKSRVVASEDLPPDDTADVLWTSDKRPEGQN